MSNEPIGLLAGDPASPTLDDAQLAVLAGFGERRSVAVGDVLYADGDAGYDFFVVLSGAVDIIGTFDGVEEVLVTHTAGRFLGRRGPRRRRGDAEQMAVDVGDAHGFINESKRGATGNTRGCRSTR